MVQGMELGQQISTYSTCSMLEKVLMELEEVDLGIGPTLFPPIIQVIMVYHLVLIVMVITEVEIDITPETFMHKTMTD